MPELLVIGGGRMGAALVAGLLRAGWNPGSIAVVEKSSERRDELGALLPGVAVRAESLDIDLQTTQSNEPTAAVLAVKPLNAEEACGLATRAEATRVLSIMAGVPIRALETWLGGGANPTAVLRAMPNTPALVGAGVSALAGSEHSTNQDFEWAASILQAVGTVIRVDEGLLDAVTGLSGSGPAYIFRAVEALAEAGVQAGLPRDVSQVLARQTVVGAGRLLAESEDEPEVLRAQVTSPGGTTEAGLAALESHGLEKAISEAVAAATRRSREMGAELAQTLEGPGERP
jgi:pyrroline-5-carboxylate reductase